MSSCLSGGGRGYGLELGMFKSSPTSTRTSNGSSSPSSTISELSDSPICICTRKPRTQRKRPNQKYHEAAALLSTAYPKIFSPTNIRTPLKFSSSTDDNSFFDESSDLLLPFRAIDKSEFLLHHDHVQENGRPSFRTEYKPSSLSERPCHSPGETEIQSNPIEFFNGYQEEFDADSILDEEMEEGIIDTIMGNVYIDAADNGDGKPGLVGTGSGFGGKFDCGFGFGNGAEMNALRNVNGVNNWWDFHFPAVDVLEISPKFNKSPLANSAEKRKKRKNAKKAPKPEEEPKGGYGSIEVHPSTVGPNPRPKPELLLKLNYDGILSEWSGRGSPFSDESSSTETLGNDVSARLAQIDLFPEAGGVREAIVQRYKEKRRTRLFSKKVRYQVRKDNADQRPRMKGRFVRQSGSSSNKQKGVKTPGPGRARDRKSFPTPN